MWLILSLFLRKRRQLAGILHLLNTMSVLLCLAECACIVERTSNVAYSSNFPELLGDLVLIMAEWYAQYLLLLTSGTVIINLLSAAGSPNTPNAPPLALTTASLAQEPSQLLLVITFGSIYAQ